MITSYLQGPSSHEENTSLVPDMLELEFVDLMDTWLYLSHSNQQSHVYDAE